MIGHMISKIRKEKGITKTQLASQTDINIGHLTHIEKGERNPSHKALREICYALNVPYQPFLYAYDQTLNKEQIDYKYLNHISYNKVPAISNIDGYIECPYDFAKASFAYKVPDNAMEPIIKEGSYAYVEINGLIENRAVGLFKLNDQYLIRRLMYKKDKFVLRADNKDVKDITVSLRDKFQIIGRVYI
jgi:transcriptional regulator with XRE-family HTH domain